MFRDNESNLSSAELDYLNNDDGPLYMHSDHSASSGPRRSKPPQPEKMRKTARIPFGAEQHWGCS